MPHFHLDRTGALLALGLCLLVILPAVPFWDVPLSRDQGVYATCANELIRGGVPYLECWDTKGPALHYTYALARLLFGLNTSGPYILNTFVIALSGILLAQLVRRWFAPRLLAYGIGLLYGWLAVAVRFDMNAQPESFANFWALLGLLTLTPTAERPHKRWRYAVGGALLAVAVLYKYALLLPYGVMASAILIARPLPESTGAPIKRHLMSISLALAGAVGLVVVFAGYLALRGALDDALLHLRFIIFFFPDAQLNPDEFALRSQPVRQTLAYFGRLPIVIALAMAGLGLGAARRRWYAWPLIISILACIAVVWGQQRFTPYHWTVMLPLLAVDIGILVDELRRTIAIQPRFVQVTSAGIAAAALVNTGMFFYQDQWLIMGPYLTGAESEEAFLTEMGAWDHQVIADYIRERTDPADPVYVWGHQTGIYYLADRHTPSRFIYNEPLLMRIRRGHPWQSPWRQELADDLYADPPVYLVLTLFDRTFFDFQNPNDSWNSIDEYRDLLERHYLLEFPFGRFQTYRLIPYWSRQNEPELLDAVTVHDLIADFESVTVLQESDPPVDVTTFSVPPEPGYDTLLMQPDASIMYPLVLPDAPVCLRFDLSLFPDSWAWGGDGVTFIVDVETAGGSQRLFDFYLENDPLNQHWHAHLLDLSAYAGQSIALVLTTTPGPQGDYTGDWAGWGLPRLVSPPSGDLCDTNAIVDTR